MEYLEFYVDEIQCPFCDYEFGETVQFHLGMADSGGVLSSFYKTECGACFKKFWFNAFLEFNVEVYHISKTKPKSLKGK